MEEKRKPGRPRLFETKRTQVTFYVDLETLDRVDRAADAEGITRSEWINRAIQERLERNRPSGSE